LSPSDAAVLAATQTGGVVAAGASWARVGSGSKMRCAENDISALSGHASSAIACQARCEKNDKCKFAVFWSDGGCGCYEKCTQIEHTWPTYSSIYKKPEPQPKPQPKPLDAGNLAAGLKRIIIRDAPALMKTAWVELGMWYEGLRSSAVDGKFLKYNGYECTAVGFDCSGLCGPNDQATKGNTHNLKVGWHETTIPTGFMVPNPTMAGLEKLKEEVVGAFTWGNANVMVGRDPAGPKPTRLDTVNSAAAARYAGQDSQDARYGGVTEGSSGGFWVDARADGTMKLHLRLGRGGHGRAAAPWAELLVCRRA